MDEILIWLIFAHYVKYFLDDMISIEIIAAFFDPVPFIKLLHHQHLLVLLEPLEARLDNSAALFVQRVVHHVAFDFVKY